MKMKLRKQAVFSALAVSILLTPIAYSQSTFVGETASVMGACGKLFDVDANAAGLTAQERAAAIQKNLDYAIIHAKNRGPNAVDVVTINNNPVVVLDGFPIATADGNSATRHRLTQMQLARQWADSIKLCLADAAAMDKYVCLLTGNYPAAVTGQREERIAYARAGMFLPVRLSTCLDSENSQ